MYLDEFIFIFRFVNFVLIVIESPTFMRRYNKYEGKTVDIRNIHKKNKIINPLRTGGSFLDHLFFSKGNVCSTLNCYNLQGK
jgi:hypothetical protein